MIARISGKRKAGPGHLAPVRHAIVACTRDPPRSRAAARLHGFARRRPATERSLP